jgi:hypothetical protein
VSHFRREIADVKKTVDSINSRFADNCDVEFFKVAHYDGQSLRIYASRDFTVCHNFELIFEKVSFFKGDFEWSRDDEKLLVDLVEIAEDPGQLRFKFRLYSDGYYYSNHNHLIEIWAQNISYDSDTVFYWNKENLNAGERIAAWVKKG